MSRFNSASSPAVSSGCIAFKSNPAMYPTQLPTLGSTSPRRTWLTVWPRKATTSAVFVSRTSTRASGGGGGASGTNPCPCRLGVLPPERRPSAMFRAKLGSWKLQKVEPGRA
jgi:hypothetical protein